MDFGKIIDFLGEAKPYIEELAPPLMEALEDGKISNSEIIRLIFRVATTEAKIQRDRNKGA